ncbi:proline-rich receptor-like protein kinase PERK1 isoform X2 [Neltuma alba]|uniref:proline-rich receptor-like protein kinase PERK1 isoform X2 n=1 Tax=Neltuma alba TaxID=207710 RepID=UPI0010A526CF|nr:proline-rich receptor-like protein kinase PERK1 isoform X2 [Prosopis alba]
MMIVGLVSAGLFIWRRNRARERENPSAPPQPQDVNHPQLESHDRPSASAMTSQSQLETHLNEEATALRRRYVFALSACTPQDSRPSRRLLSYSDEYSIELAPSTSPSLTSPSPSPSYPPPPSPPAGPQLGDLLLGALLSSLMTLLLLTLVIGVFYVWRKRRHSPQPPNQPAAAEEVAVSLLPSSIAFEHSPGTFTYEELELATDGFSESNFLGQGGFGTVHKGVLPKNNQSVAIKQQRSGSRQGMQEFQTEVKVISRVHHRHLVSLVGYCIAESQRTLMLVYEFVPNKTLDFQLHGEDTETLDWSTRMKIANGSAKGLAYLHEDCEPKIIHRDIKAANILIDNNFEPKIADFGLAKLSSDTDTHVTTARIKGTFGYLAPEYASSGRLTEKADVFSFGVVLLELITGRKPVLQTGSFTEDSLVEWARRLLSTALDNRNFEVLADPKLQNNYNSEEMFRMASCAANCVRHSADRRPRMSQVVDGLAGKISVDNWNEESTEVDLNKFWKGALGGGNSTGEYSEPSSSSSRENTTEGSS